MGFGRSQPESSGAKKPLQDPRSGSKVSPTCGNLGPTGDNLAPCWSEFHIFFYDFCTLILEWPKSRIYCKIHIATRFFDVRNVSKNIKDLCRKHFLVARESKTDFWRSKTAVRAQKEGKNGLRVKPGCRRRD